MEELSSGRGRRNNFEVTWDVTLETYWYPALKKFAERIEELEKEKGE
jgi:hypothetical protein